MTTLTTLVTKDIEINSNRKKYLNLLIKQKAKALTIHLVISFLIISSILAFAYFIWFTTTSFDIIGVKKIFIMVLAADLIIGPFLTFIVFNPSKKSLKLDLSIIAALQLSALIYGTYTIYQAHPVYITFTVDRFSLVSARDADTSQAKYPEYKISTFGKPVLAYASLPTDPDRRNEVLESVLFQNGLDVDALPEFYLPFNAHKTEILTKGIDTNLIQAHAEGKPKLETFLQHHGKSAAEYAFIPFVGTAKVVLWAWDRETQEPIGVLDIDPWTLN